MTFANFYDHDTQFACDIGGWGGGGGGGGHEEKERCFTDGEENWMMCC